MTKEELLNRIQELEKENTELELRLEDENYWLGEENLEDEVKDLEQQVSDLEDEVYELKHKYNGDILSLDFYNYNSLVETLHEKLRHYSPLQIEAYLKRL